MDQFVQLVVSIALLWFVFSVVVAMVSRPAALAMNRWAGRMAVRAIRATAGGIFVGIGRLIVAFGNWIRR